MSNPNGRKPIRISVGGRGGPAGASRKAGKKRKRPSAADDGNGAPISVRGSGVGVCSASSLAGGRSSFGSAPAAAAAVPALFLSRPRGRSGRSIAGDEDGGAEALGTEEAGAEAEADEYGPLDALADVGGGEDGDDASSSGVLLALRSLVRRGAAALCPPPPLAPPGSARPRRPPSPVPFVLRPMLQRALLSTVTSSAVASASDATFFGGGNPSVVDGAEARARADEANRAASAEASTGLEVELARLRKSRRGVRLVQLHGTGDAEGDVAVMETAEYVRGCTEAVEAELASSSSYAPSRANGAGAGGGGLPVEERRAILDFFVEGLGSWTRTSVGEAEVEESLRRAQRRPPGEGGGAERPPRVGVRSVLDYLASAGVLLPRRDAPSSASYWFSLPGMGAAARLVAKGRARVLAKLRSARYGELKRSVLEMGVVEVEEGKRSASVGSITGMPAAFVVRDLLSRGAVKTKETPAGEFVKLVQP